MKKIVLLSAGGMFTSVLVKKMQAAAQKSGFDCKILSCPAWEAGDNAKDADLILLDPQVRYQADEIAEQCPGRLIVPMETCLYGCMDGDALLNFALKKMGVSEASEEEAAPAAKPKASKRQNAYQSFIQKQMGRFLHRDQPEEQEEEIPEPEAVNVKAAPAEAAAEALEQTGTAPSFQPTLAFGGAAAAAAAPNYRAATGSTFRTGTPSVQPRRVPRPQHGYNSFLQKQMGRLAREKKAEEASASAAAHKDNVVELGEEAREQQRPVVAARPALSIVPSPAKRHAMAEHAAPAAQPKVEVREPAMQQPMHPQPAMRRPAMQQSAMRQPAMQQPAPAAPQKPARPMNAYQSFLQKQMAQVAQREKLASQKIPANMNYDMVGSLREEARKTLAEARPKNLGQASRIPGITNEDIKVLNDWMEEQRRMWSM